MDAVAFGKSEINWKKVAEYMANNAYSPKIKILGIPDAFVEHGTPEQLYEKCGMDKKSVLSAILEFNGVAGQ